MQPQENDVNKIMFMHLVSMLAMSAIQQMGKLVDPGTGKAEINLEAAQATIDMLDMLEARTRGNLDAEETKLIKDTLMSLKMNYVESLEQKTDDGPARNATHSVAGGRQTTDDGPAKAGGGAEDRRQTPDDGRQPAHHSPLGEGGTADSGEKQAESDKGKQTPNSERPTPNAECRKTDPASPRGYAGASNGMPEQKSDKEPPKDPKFHKNYS